MIPKHAGLPSTPWLALILCLAGNSLAWANTDKPLAALSLHGDAKYSSRTQPFTHFDYTNPQAPKGGTLRMAGFGTFDSLNPYINKGTSVSGIDLLYDTLMEQSKDEAFSLYPLIAESAVLPEDRQSITFNLNPQARFHDGSPITAEDAKYTFELLMEKGHPQYRSYYGDVAEVKVLSPRQVQFIFKHRNNPELPFILAQLPILPKHYWEKPEHDFAAGSLDIPLGSGPYKVKDLDSGRSISFSRNEDYWAKDLPVNKGRYNIDLIRYDYYRDQNVALQAMLAGDYDFRTEYMAKNWATAYDVPAVKNGDLILETVKTRSPAPMQGFAYNLRKPQFQHRAVRRALAYAMDFEWLNRNLFYNTYARSKSYFNNSDMSATGIPDGGELELLEPWRKQLPPKLFNTPYALPVTDGSGNIRPQLSEALKLLESAGWTLNQGKLVNPKGEPLKIELLLSQASMERVALPFKKNLALMGIELNIRTLDISQYIQRIRSFDFDMIVVGYPQSASPGNEQAGYWGSLSANVEGSHNYMGIENPVVDAMIEKVTVAKTREELTNAVKALDRVLLWGDYLIPQWYSPHERLAYAKKLKHPKSEPLYSIDRHTWWIEEDTTINKNRTSSTTESNTGNHLISILGIGGLVILALFWLTRRRKPS